MIKAIETRYKGYRFRSRLEARWAVFFETAGIKWQYEVEGFETPFGRYLPDFYLPEIRNGLWVEVKPSIGGKKCESDKLESVVQQTGKEGIFVRDIPSPGLDPYQDFPGVDDWSAWAIIQDGSDGVGPYDCAYVFCVCPWCGKPGLEFDGRGARVCQQGSPCSEARAARRNRMEGPDWDPFDRGPDEVIDSAQHYKSLSHDDKAYSFDHPKLANAYDAARSARFEHGETP